jgi:5-methylcytosine-specific restriction protein A
MSEREFRSKESYVAELITRDMLKDFLLARGFSNVHDERKKRGPSESQTIRATSQDGTQLIMRIKLCWRRKAGERRYPAVQLMAEVKNGDWEGTLEDFVERAKKEGTTHFLFIDREGQQITYAALLPISDLVAIWCAQRDISTSLIAAGLLGRRQKNHAMNGSSPTLWLEDEMAPTVAAALWDHPNVLNLVDLKVVNLGVLLQAEVDDTYEDLPGIDHSLLGSDGPEKVKSTMSLVKRDHRVRQVVIKRSRGQCERASCGERRSFPGFLDVHHVLGAAKSDRVWNCVAICPNCHREAHYGPDRDKINASLLEFAMSFNSSTNRHEGN